MPKAFPDGNYLYSKSNPLALSDPSGKDPEDNDSQPKETDSQEDESSFSNSLSQAYNQLNYFQFGGYSLNVTWDSYQRLAYKYTIRGIRNYTTQGVMKGIMIGDASITEQFAKTGSGARNIARSATQNRLTWGGRMLSSYLERDRSWGFMLDRYRPNGSRNPSSHMNSTYLIIAKKTGSSNYLLSFFTSISRVTGPVFLTYELVTMHYTVMAAPLENRGKAIFEEGFGFAGSSAGASIGMGGGAALAGVLFGSNPPGWAVIGLGVVGGVVVSAGGGEIGREVGGSFYSAYNNNGHQGSQFYCPNLNFGCYFPNSGEPEFPASSSTQVELEAYQKHFNSSGF